MLGADEYEFPFLQPQKLPSVPFMVVDPRDLPDEWQEAFERFLIGVAVPHPIYVYQHDYERFCLLVKQGEILI
ncbi:conserved hypothetical protein [Vibrio crassostreae]|uniref:hypothetical protein n=1 Tax=Vibrio TaxID=662 RepID=UPI000EFDB1E0|nr:MULTISPECIES: hypothetical protein [Vibrio]TCN77959.1 hypothetical protein EDB37_10472 [Vibrio crassostreae]CAK2508816.1 conserved hypothetical protein [Vibrio crassostreae]CAK2512735.1 conserved hypothetical protein [Vibrio crassostreae]CAK3855719.1 conserved hypothetical protein [Vibrio crassostreae]CAK3987853.1 conserved hypothetical protein [Vibrio crassostreae]